MKIKMILLTLAIAITACDDPESPPTKLQDPPAIPEYGYPPAWMDTVVVDTTRIGEPPFEDEEAEWMALWLSRDLVAPRDVCVRLKRDLAKIRADYDSLDPPLKGKFGESWKPSNIIVGLTQEAIDRYLQGTYTDLDDYNRLFRLSFIYDPGIDAWNTTLSLFFEGRLHPARLAEFYRGIESVAVVDIWNWGVGAHRIYPWYAHGQLTYLFREGWGWGCPQMWCEYVRYWYFRSDDTGEIEYVGTYTPSEEDVDPEWWPEAKRNRDVFEFGYWDD